MTGKIPSDGPPGGPNWAPSLNSETLVGIKREVKKDEKVQKVKANLALATQPNPEATLNNRVSRAISGEVCRIIEAEKRTINLTTKKGTHDESLLSQFTNVVSKYVDAIYIGDADCAHEISLEAIDIAKCIFNKEVQDKNGDTLLHIACRENMIEVVIFLLEQGGYEKSMNKSNKNRETPLSTAWNKGHKVIYDLMVEKSDLADRLINLEDRIYLDMESKDTLCMPNSISRMSKADGELFSTLSTDVLGVVIQFLPECSAVIMEMIKNKREIPNFLQNITYLDLSHLKNVNECWQVLKICKKVESLKLPEHFKSVDNCIEVIEKANLSHLRAIDLANTKLTDRGFSSLSRMSLLEELNLRSCRTLTFSGFNALSKLQNIQEINFSVCDITWLQKDFCAEHEFKKEDENIIEITKTMENLVRESGRPAVFFMDWKNSSIKNVEDIVKTLSQDVVITVTGSDKEYMISRPASAWNDISVLFKECKQFALIISCK